MRSSLALFLDRDGIINLDHGYVCHSDQIVFVDGIFDLCRHAYSLNYLIIVITNQSGIGRGYFPETTFQHLMDWMKIVFLGQGCPITQVYFCPYHPTEGLGSYKRDSLWRKPQPGMILAAEQDFDLNLQGSVLVGDSARDIAAGQVAGVGCNLLYAQNLDNKESVSPTAIVSCLSQVKSYIN